MNRKIFFLSILCFLGFSGIVQAQGKAQKEVIKTLRDEIVQDLNGNILPFWKKYSVDPSGGFYGGINFDGSPRANAQKGNVLNGRLIWTYSTAYRIFGDKEALELANRAQRYFIDHFIDKEYGGTYWSLRADGTPGDNNKQTYGIAFAIYGLSEHYRATGNEESLKMAIELYQSLEKYAFEPEFGGYIESFTRDWKKPVKYGYDGDGTSPKTMNTHLHVLEAYTNLYRVWPDAGLRKQLKALAEIAITKILNTETYHEMLYFTNDWKSKQDIDSYGHDIEYSWLIDEAGKVLNDKKLKKKIQEVSVKVAETQMKEGLNADGSMKSERKGEEVSTTLSWWPQAETVVGFLNAYEISGDEKFLNGAVKAWGWIKEKMIDRQYGEWYGTVMGDGSPVLKGEKGSLWRCPYHNSRMGFEVYERFEHLK